MRLRRLYANWVEKINPPVFFGAALFVIANIIFGAIWTREAGLLFSGLLEFISRYFGWYYILCVNGILVFVVWLFFSRYGKIRLGGENQKPEFGNLSWFGMLFAAGMGMGLVFWSVAEPISHWQEPLQAPPRTDAAAREGLRLTFFHWGLHPWAIYIVFALGIAYYHFRYGLPLAPRSLLFPFLGKKIHGWIGHVVDAFCTVGTLLGVATSLGLGALQINAGLTGLSQVSYTLETQIWIIGIITLIATASTVSGVHHGIKYLSNANIILAGIVLAFVFIAGPTLFNTKLFVRTLGDYFQNLIGMSFWIDLRTGSTWQTKWTIFYWGWWISWCPFVGIFVARISRGRTIREFIFFVFLIPVAVTFLWLTVFGGTALHLEMQGGNPGIAAAVSEHEALALNALLVNLPFSRIMQWVGLFLIVIFFITSSDSGSLVDDMVTSGGHPDPPALNRVFWGLAEGGTAAVLLMAGGLKALQAASISAGLPQSFLVIIASWGLVRALRKDFPRETVKR